MTGGRSLKGLVRQLGPGLLTGAADDDPSGIATYNVYSSLLPATLPSDGNVGVFSTVAQATKEMQLVHYILNNPRGKNGTIPTNFNDVQFALWQALNNPSTITANSTALYNDALANGIGFTPGLGQEVAVILDPQTPANSPQKPWQGIILPVRFPCLLSSLGPAGAFGILGLQGATIQLSSGPLQVNANVGIGANGNIHLSGGATLQSILYADPLRQCKLTAAALSMAVSLKNPLRRFRLPRWRKPLRLLPNLRRKPSAMSRMH